MLSVPISKSAEVQTRGGRYFSTEYRKTGLDSVISLTHS